MQGEAAFLCHSQYGSVDYRAAACNKLAVGDRWRHGLAGYSGTVLPACGHTLDLSGPVASWYAVATILVALLGAVWLLCRSRYGKVLAAISTNEWRALACGYHTSWHLLLMFVASAVLAAVAGCLMAAAAGVVAPDVFSPVLATEVILWVAIGGRGSLGGPMLAAVGLTLLKHGASSLSTQWWPLILGAVFSRACFACRTVCVLGHAQDCVNSLEYRLNACRALVRSASKEGRDERADHQRCRTVPCIWRH